MTMTSTPVTAERPVPTAVGSTAATTPGPGLLSGIRVQRRLRLPAAASLHGLQSLLLRAGLAFVFVYATIAMLLDPSKFSTYVPSFLPAAWVDGVFLPAFSAFELVLAGLLLAGRRLFAVSLLSAMTMAGIIVVNMDSFGVLFRNVAIACAALSLAVQAREAQLSADGPVLAS